MQTTNYGLYITDDSTESFINWRRKIGGVGSDSNMVKIDAILKEVDDSMEPKGKITISDTEYSVTRKALRITDGDTTTTYYIADIT